MCLPLKFVQLFIRINCVCFVSFGIILLTQVFITLSENKNNDGNGVIFTFCVGLAIIIVGISGLLSSYCPNFAVILIYSCFIIFIGILTSYLTICLTILQRQLSSEEDSFDCKTSEIPGALKTKEQVLWAETQFCKSSCICFLENIEEWDPEYLENNRIVYTTNPLISNVTRYQDCSKSIKIEGAHTEIYISLEQSHNCSGWCKQHPVYLFSDVNKGQPTNSCYTFYEQEYKQYVNQSYIDYLIIDILYIINLAFAICQCYQTNRTIKLRIYPQIVYELAAN